MICDFSSKLYLDYEKAEPCNCEKCRNNEIEHKGVFIVRPNDVNSYLQNYKPVQLRWDKKKQTDQNYQTFNFGESKGQTHDRVLIYPTDKMEKWIKDNNYKFINIVKGKEKKIEGVKEKFYVAITRARHSVAIIYDYTDNEVIPNTEKFI